MHNKKGDLGQLAALATFFVTLIILFGLGSDIIQTINSNVPDLSVADNVTTQGNLGLQQFAEFAPIIGLVVVAAIVIGIVKQF